MNQKNSDQTEQEQPVSNQANFDKTDSGQIDQYHITPTKLT